jgi:glycosyltransferase involved in cell wall biosynthesis
MRSTLRDGKVLLVAASNRRRGAEVFTDQLVRGLAEAGMAVTAVALTRSGDGATVDLESLTDMAPETAGRFDRRIHTALREKVKACRPRLLVAMGGPTLRYAVMARTGRPVVYFSIGEPRYWLRSRSALALNRLLWNRVDHIVAVSKMTAEQMIDMSPRLAGRVTVVPTGVDDDLFDVVSSPGTGRTALFIGSLSPEKDPLLAVESVARTKTWELVIVGTGPLRDQLEGAIAETGLGDRITLLGALEDLRPQLADADLLLLTSRTEGLPGVVLEAAAAGLPCLGVNVGGVAEAIVDGVTGLVVPRETDAIVAALDDLAAEPDRLRQMGQAGRARAMQEFRLQAAIDRFARVLDEVSP